MSVPKHLEPLLVLSPSVSLAEIAEEHRDYMITRSGEYPLWTDVLLDIDRIKDEAWRQRADEEAAAFEAITND